MPSGLEQFLGHVPAWALVLFRITGIFIMGPMYGSQTIPPRVKIFIALTLSLCIYPMLLTTSAAAAPLIQRTIEQHLSLWQLLPAVAMELAIGLVIGFGANLPIVGMQMGGRMIEQQMGLGIAGVFNPELGATSGPLSQFITLFAITLFVILGGHRVVLTTLVGSFGHVPLGGFRVDGHVIDLAVGLLSSMFDLALRVGAPLLCLIFLASLAMGFIARTVPQMNILSIGFVLRIVAGALLLVGLVGVFAALFQDHTESTLDAVTRFFNPH